MQKNKLQYMQKKKSKSHIGDSKPGQTEDLSSTLLKEIQKRASVSCTFKQQ